MPREHISRIPKRPPVAVEGWLVYLRRALKIRRHVGTPGEDRLVRTAGLIALLGDTNAPEALEVYTALVPLLFSYHRIQSWTAMLDRIPPEREKLLRIAKAVKAAHILDNLFEKARFNGSHFIAVAVQLPDALGFVECSKREGRNTIGGVFSEQNLKYIADRYRGVVGGLADPAYMTDLTSRLNTVT